MFDSNSKYGTNIVGCKGLQFKLYMRCAIQRFSNLMCLYFRGFVAFMSFLHAFSCYATSLEVLRVFHLVINLFLLLVLCCCFLMPSWWPKICPCFRSKAIYLIKYSGEFSKSRIVDSKFPLSCSRRFMMVTVHDENIYRERRNLFENHSMP